MEIEKLNSFIEVYNCRSISRAAENLFISQPALSRRIQSLESELKTELFTRNGTKMEPTNAANTLYKEAIKILHQHNQAVIKMNQFKMGEGGTLRIGVLPNVKQSPIVRAVSLMRKKYPQVELSFDSDQHTNVPLFLANRRIDVGITVYGEVCGLDGFACEVLSKNTLAVLIGRTHRLWNKRPLYAEDLNGEKLYYLQDTASHCNTAVSQFYKTQNVKFLEMIPCRSITEQMLYLAKGDGIAHAGIVSAESYFAMRDLIDVIPIERSSLNQGYVIALYDEGNELAKKFVELLKETW